MEFFNVDDVSTSPFACTVPALWLARFEPVRSGVKAAEDDREELTSFMKWYRGQARSWLASLSKTEVAVQRLIRASGVEPTY
jgi:hypothetical protein